MKYALNNSPYLPGYDSWKTSEPDEDYHEDEEGCRHDWKFLGMSADGDSFYKCRKCGEEDN